jgi:hypothetical protein
VPSDRKAYFSDHLSSFKRTKQQIDATDSFFDGTTIVYDQMDTSVVQTVVTAILSSN